MILRPLTKEFTIYCTVSVEETLYRSYMFSVYGWLEIRIRMLAENFRPFFHRNLMKGSALINGHLGLEKQLIYFF